MSMEKSVNVLEILNKEYSHARYYLTFKNPLQLLVAAILSAQVRDEVVNAATPALFEKYKTAQDFAKAHVDDLVKHISKISFAGNKAKNIISACQIIASKHQGAVPKTMEELVELPGVGRKTANVVLQNAYGIIIGIPCDTHVLRIAYRLGWTKNTNPEKVESDLMARFDKHWWGRIPHLMKAHGRLICQASIPKCSTCRVAHLCPKAGVKKSV